MKSVYTVSLVCAAALLASPALAQSWPERTIKIIAPSAPGGGFDLTARMLAEKLAPALGVSPPCQ